MTRGFLARAASMTRRYRCGEPSTPRTHGFRKALERGFEERGLGVIGEYKRCAPGRILANHEPWWYAQSLAPYIDAFSVLTEPFWFCGSPRLIPVFAAHHPVLAKDFVECEAQLVEAREAGASATLLILDQLGWERLDQLYSEAKRLGLEALIETSRWRDAVEIAASYPEAVVGINARNLETLELSFERLVEEVRRASERLPSGALLVAESSVDSVEKALKLREAGAHAVLIGTWFMRRPEAARELHEALSGRFG